MYNPALVQPMREELTQIGVKELRDPAEVDQAFSNPEETTFVVVNSVCGCAAGGARPAVALALKGEKVPTKAVTVFAGQDKEATERVRSYFIGYPPSSPCFALMRGDTVLEMIPRQEIEGYSPDQIADKIRKLFETHL